MTRQARQVRVVPFSEMTVLPPADPDACRECAVVHEPEEAHNRDSLHYQYVVYQRLGRWPTWRDAIAHCAPERQAVWVKALGERGIDVDK